MDEDVRFRIIYPIINSFLNVRENSMDVMAQSPMKPGTRFIIPRDQKLDGL